MTRFIVSIVVIIAVYIALVIGLAYVGYFVGMTVALAATSILGVEYAIIPQIFAWMGVACASYIVVKAGSGVSSVKTVELTDEDAKEFAHLFEDKDERESD